MLYLWVPRTSALQAQCCTYGFGKPVPSRTAHLHVLQLLFPHLFIDGLLLHPVRRDAGALLEDVHDDSPEGATVAAA